MSITYYRQSNYSHVPYPSASYPNATVSSGGCGVCCASMMLSAFGIKVPPAEMAKKAISYGARVDGGTDMKLLSQRLAKEYGLSLIMTNDVSVLEENMKKGYVAICNVGGNRSGYKGVFSTGGHYIVAYGLTSKVYPIIYDSGYYSGKYSTVYRKQYVTVGENNQLYAPFSVIDKDCSNRNPRYYIFYKEGETVAEKITNVEEAKKVLKEKAGLASSTITFLSMYKYGDDLILKLANAMI